MDPGQTRREGGSTPFPGQDVGETDEKPENGLRTSEKAEKWFAFEELLQHNNKKHIKKKTQLTVLKTLCYLKKNYKNRLAALITINF